MADNRTGLSPADIAESFRDRCGDGSMEWVYTPMQTWVLLDAADMLDEVADAPKCETCEAMLDCDECLRADASQKERKRLDYENAKLRELLVGAFEDMNAWQMVIACSNEWGYGKGCLDRLCKLRDAMQELGMEVVV